MTEDTSGNATKVIGKARNTGKAGATPTKAATKSVANSVAKSATKSVAKSVAKSGTGQDAGRDTARIDGEPVLLSGGNPQIAKGEGDAPVQAYVAAMPGWKHDVGRRLDALIVRTVPGVRKAVKWNSLLYGVEGQGWFLGVHCFTRYVKIAFFRGTSIKPVPPVSSKNRETRYFHIHEDDAANEATLAAWVKQASELPGERI